MERKLNESEKLALIEIDLRAIKKLTAQVDRRCSILREQTNALHENNKLLARNNSVLENKLKSIDEMIDMLLESEREFDE